MKAWRVYLHFKNTHNRIVIALPEMNAVVEESLAVGADDPVGPGGLAGAFETGGLSLARPSRLNAVGRHKLHIFLFKFIA